MQSPILLLLAILLMVAGRANASFLKEMRVRVDAENSCSLRYFFRDKNRRNPRNVCAGSLEMQCIRRSQ